MKKMMLRSRLKWREDDSTESTNSWIWILKKAREAGADVLLCVQLIVLSDLKLVIKKFTEVSLVLIKRFL